MDIDRRKFLKIVGFGTLGIIGVAAINNIPKNILVNADEITEGEAMSVIGKISSEAPRKYAGIKRTDHRKVLYIPKLRPMTACTFGDSSLGSAMLETITINISELEDSVYEKYYQALDNNKRPWGIILCPEHEIALSYCSNKYLNFPSDHTKPIKLMGLDVMRSEILDISQSPMVV